MAGEKIGVFGSSEGASSEISGKAREVGELLGSKEVIIITGACPGIPYEAALAAYDAYRAEIWGFSPASNLGEHLRTNRKLDNTIYAKLFFIPDLSDYLPEAETDINVARKLRNVPSTARSDGGVIISGRIGTLNEYTNLYDMGKVIGVLVGTGGTADLLPTIHQAISKPSSASVYFNDSPGELVDQVLEEIQIRKASA